MHQCVNENIRNFAIFGPIFVKFSSEIGNVIYYFGKFVSFLDSEGGDIHPQNRHRKIPDHSIVTKASISDTASFL